MIEEVDDPLQLLEGGLLLGPVAADVGDLPDRAGTFLPPLPCKRQRPDANPVPARLPLIAAKRMRKADFLFRAALGFGRTGQVKDCLGRGRIGGEHPLHAAYVRGALGIDQPRIGIVRIDDAPVALCDQHTLVQRVEKGGGHRTGRRARGKAQQADSPGKEREDTDDGKHPQQRQHIGLCLVLAHHRERDCRGDEPDRQRNQQADIAGPFGAFDSR